MSAYVYGFLIGWGACGLSFVWLVAIRPHVFCAKSHGCCNWEEP